MKSSIPIPVVAAIIAVLVLVVGFLLWKKTGDASGAGDVQAMTNEVKGKGGADFTPDQAQGDAAVKGMQPLKKGGR